MVVLTPRPKLRRSPWTWVPFGLSLAALGLIGGFVLLARPLPSPGGDEGAAARLFQLLLALDLVAILGFAARWLPAAGREAAIVLVLQAAAMVVPIAVIALLEST
jgi:hypothetical protein